MVCRQKYFYFAGIGSGKMWKKSYIEFVNKRYDWTYYQIGFFLSLQ